MANGVIRLWRDQAREFLRAEDVDRLELLLDGMPVAHDRETGGRPLNGRLAPDTGGLFARETFKARRSQAVPKPAAAPIVPTFARESHFTAVKSPFPRASERTRRGAYRAVTKPSC